MKRIKVNDEVIVISGKDKGREGKVIRIDEDRLFVRNVNMIKKHLKPNPMRGEQGGIIDKEASIHISNVMIKNPDTSKADKIGFKMVDGKKIRFFKSNDKQVNYK